MYKAGIDDVVRAYEAAKSKE
jgi:hypothetical protein